MMKAKGLIILLISAGLFVSCRALNKSSSLLQEDELFITRKYIGDFVDYRHTAAPGFGSPHLIWIKTNLDSTYGKISAYSRNCKFVSGDRLYLKRTFSSPGVFGYWVYQIENDKSVAYRLSEYQYDKKILVQTWY